MERGGGKAGDLLGIPRNQKARIGGERDYQRSVGIGGKGEGMGNTRWRLSGKPSCNSNEF